MRRLCLMFVAGVAVLATSTLASRADSSHGGHQYRHYGYGQYDEDYRYRPYNRYQDYGYYRPRYRYRSHRGADHYHHNGHTHYYDEGHGRHYHHHGHHHHY